MDISLTSQDDILALAPSKDDVTGLETSQDSNLLQGDGGEDQQEDDQNHLGGLAQYSNHLWFKP